MLDRLRALACRHDQGIIDDPFFVAEVKRLVAKPSVTIPAVKPSVTSFVIFTDGVCGPNLGRAADRLANKAKKMAQKEFFDGYRS